MRAHETYPCQKVDVASLLANSSVQHEKLLVPYHLRVYHVAEGVPADEERHEMGDMLAEIVKDDSIKGAVVDAPDLDKGELDGDQDSIGWHHQQAPPNVDGQEYQNKLCRVVLVLLHELVDFVRVKVLQKADQQ